MTGRRLSTDDYPLAEKRPDRVSGPRGKPLPNLTLDGVVSGAIDIEDLRITPEALLQQAEIARSANRDRLAENFERAAEMTALPQDLVMEIYEMLRPGRATSEAALRDLAERLRTVHGADRLAAFVTEAAEVYAKRGLLRTRY